MKCKICDYVGKGRAFASHLQAAHKMTSKEYTIEHIYNGIQPGCEVCGGETRYVAFTFKSVCKEHAKEAMRKGGIKGGKAQAWNKGLTKETDERIKLQAESMEGEKNHFFGKKHTVQTISKLSNIKRLTREQFWERCAIRKDVTVLTSYNDYVEHNQKMEVVCELCGHVFQSSLHNMQTISQLCPECRDNSVSLETRQKISKKRRFSEEEYSKKCDLQDEFEVLTPYKDYLNQFQKLDVKCQLCGDLTMRTLQQMLHGTFCHKCNPRSLEERELADFVSSMGMEVINNTTDLISPYEIDIYVPERHIAIEYNGLYWHSEKQKPNVYHKNKTDMCAAKDTQLLHFFSDEWLQKPEIVKSMIRHRLGKSKNRIHARSCDVRLIDKKDEREFFDKSHISGYIPSKICFALVKGEEIVMALSVREPLHRQKYGDNLEIARFATKPDAYIPGGFSKLFKRAKEYAVMYGKSGIMTYADLRFGTGHVYENYGFRLVGQTVLDYWYTDHYRRFGRGRCKARDGYTERQIAANEGLCRIYGCGSNIYILNL